MSIPIFDDMQNRMAPVWEEQEFRQYVLWAGIFGSVARNRAHLESDVDIVCVFKEHLRRGEPVDLRERLIEACGREISLLCIWQGHDWARDNVRVEALLSSRTIYGDRADIEHLRADGKKFLQQGLDKFTAVGESIKRIKKQVQTVQTFENFMLPKYHIARQDCLQSLKRISDLLDIKPLHHPLRTVLVHVAYEQVDVVGALCRGLELEHSNNPAEQVKSWKEVWDHCQPGSLTMWAWDKHCALGGLDYIRHMVASMRLAETLEDGRVADASLYEDLLRC